MFPGPQVMVQRRAAQGHNKNKQTAMHSHTTGDTLSKKATAMEVG